MHDGFAVLERVPYGLLERGHARRTIAVEVRPILDRVGTTGKPFVLRGRERDYPGLSLGRMRAVGYQWTHELRLK